MSFSYKEKEKTPNRKMGKRHEAPYKRRNTKLNK